MASCYTQKRANQRPIYIWKDLKSLLTQEMLIKMMTFWIELENIERHSKNYSTVKLPENLSQSLERDIKPWQSGRELGIFHDCWEEEWKLVLVFFFFFFLSVSVNISFKIWIVLFVWLSNNTLKCKGKLRKCTKR